MILALNTAETVHEMALLSSTPTGPRLLAEERWVVTKGDIESLVPLLEKLLDTAAATKEELTDLVLVRGPGSFTSVRMGVAFMNALAEGLRFKNKNLKLHTLTTFELLRRKAATKDPLAIVLQAGGLDVGLQWEGEPEVGPLATLLAKIPHSPALKIAAELSETLMDELHSILLEKKGHLLEAHELQSLGECLQTEGLSGLHPADHVVPFYLKAPHITHTTDPWKKP